MKKVVYLHGLESKQNCLKVHYLRDIGFEVLNPRMDYKDPNCFVNTQYQIQESNINPQNCMKLGALGCRICYCPELCKIFNIETTEEIKEHYESTSKSKGYNCS